MGHVERMVDEKLARDQTVRKWRGKRGEDN